jgi:CBS domain-containing protein
MNSRRAAFAKTAIQPVPRDNVIPDAVGIGAVDALLWTSYLRVDGYHARRRRFSMRVADILKGKGRSVMTVKPSETIGGLAQRLRLAGVGAMIVSRDGQTMDGIISERDIAYALPAHAEELHELRVSELMTVSVVTCSPEDLISDIAKTMTIHRIRHLPVKESGKLVGVISIGDVLAHRLSEMELERNVLRDIALAGR